MRVTEGTNFDIVRESIRKSKEKMEGLQHQSTTLKKINQPSDDPIAAAKLLELRTDKVNNEQYVFNGQMAGTFLNNTDIAISDLTEIVLRAKEIALNQSSQASSNDETRMGASEEISQLYANAVSVANRRIGDRYLFGGFKTQKPPVDPEGSYTGDGGQIMVEIASEVFLTVNVPGSEVFNTQPHFAQQSQRNYKSDSLSKDATRNENPENINLFSEIQNLKTGLISGNLEVVRGTLERFDQLHSRLVATRSKIGSRLQGLSSTNQAIERHNITNANLSSKLEDADIAQVATDLGKEESVFRSSLASSKRLIQPTLLDFLR
jgi:flagellar hook-associated protein 3 FlgL